MVNTDDLLALPRLADDLERLEGCLRRSVAVEDPFLEEVAGHLLGAGGKRIRPILTLAAAHRAGPATERVLLGGVAVELVHVASLYHDDVMDEATTRRNVPSVNARWGNVVAVVVGDFLLARAAGIAADLGTDVAGLLARTLARMCEGQVLEASAAFDTHRSPESYLTAIAGKTASLMSTACQIGAMCSGADATVVAAMGALGEAIGMVFQIRDDVLDLAGTPSELGGKEPGRDIAEGVYTLPVLFAMEEADAGPELAALLGGPVGPAELERVRALVLGSSALRRSLEVARRYGAEARAAAASLGDDAAARALGELGVGLVDSLSPLHA
jgi:heptaprenyl diphosphate synthase